MEDLRLNELDALYHSLSLDERDELLQCLLIAASIGGETVIQRLEEYLLVKAGRGLIEEATLGARAEGRFLFQPTCSTSLPPARTLVPLLKNRLMSVAAQSPVHIQEGAVGQLPCLGPSFLPSP